MDGIDHYLGAIVGGKYRIRQVIHSTPPMVIYRATHLDIDQDVAIQLLPGGAVPSEKWIRSFRSEARVLSKLRHPNTVELHDFGQLESGLPYLVMEYVAGRTIERALREDGPFDARRVTRVGTDVARSLRQAHQLGVYHLGINPQTVVLSNFDGEETAKVVDYMGARWAHVDSSHERTPDPRVTAPELFDDAVEPSATSDVYSLGHLLLTCVTGAMPVPDRDRERARAQHQSETAWSVPFGVPSDLAAVLRRCLAKDPAARYPSVVELLEDLESWEEMSADTMQIPTMAKPAFFPNPGQNFAGQFELDSVIGAGGYSRVYLATDSSSGQRVAIKILRPDRRTDSAEARRFVREGKLVLNMLSNPHTISVVGHGEADGLLYIAFEYIDGVHLEDLVAREGPLKADRVVWVAEQVLSSLNEAHSMGILHRDIKPSNIMLSERRGVEDWATVLDFGVAKITTEMVDTTDLTSAGSAVGTPRYMAPEQISGEAIGPESDLYSLGLVLYELITGRKAVPGHNTLEIVSHQIDPQSVILPPDVLVPAPLAIVVNKLMRKDRRTRYRSAREVLADLRGLNRDPEPETVDTGFRT